jgi:hypothetical protein
MSRSIKQFSLMCLAISVLVAPACKKGSTRNRIDDNHFPRVILWAWERPEDLEFLDPNHYAVAFLAQTLTLKNGDVIYNPRHQPLKVRPGTKLIAVTRIESQKITHERADLSDAQRKSIVERIQNTLQLDQVNAIQVDFDAVTSERDFYRKLLDDLRGGLPDTVPLSMTALASFCVGDRWLTDLPVDEAVPMVFRMGTDSERIKNLLTNGEDFRDGLCRRSFGVALDEPVKTSFEKQRRVYVFNARSWSPSDVSILEERFGG